MCCGMMCKLFVVLAPWLLYSDTNFFFAGGIIIVCMQNPKAIV